MSDLDPGEYELLKGAVEARSPQHLPLLQSLGRRPLTRDEREALRGALADEMVAVGLEPSDEPNDYGRKLDDLIGRLADF